MFTVENAQELRRQIAFWRAQNLAIAFVPTMGALHEGHLSLVRRARSEADVVVVSIFVNPTQFAPEEDLDSYPRHPKRDAALLAEEGCSLLFMPQVETLYPPGHSTFIDIEGPTHGLEGEQRPGHFRGVATVVCKLLNLVQPDCAIFGEKDAQQLAVVRKLVHDLRMPVKIIAAPIVREPDGLAMSSRNVYLSPQERRSAAVLHRALGHANQAITEGERDGHKIRQLIRQTLESEPLARVEYVEIVAADTFEPIGRLQGERLQGHCVIPIAVRFGTTRLLDNLHLDLSESAAEETQRPSTSPQLEAVTL